MSTAIRKQAGRNLISFSYWSQNVWSTSCWFVPTDTAGEVVLGRLKCAGDIVSKRCTRWVVMRYPVGYAALLRHFHAAEWQQWQYTATGIQFVLNVFCCCFFKWQNSLFQRVLCCGPCCHRRKCLSGFSSTWKHTQVMLVLITALSCPLYPPSLAVEKTIHIFSLSTSRFLEGAVGLQIKMRWAWWWWVDGLDDLCSLFQS